MASVTIPETLVEAVTAEIAAYGAHPVMDGADGYDPDGVIAAYDAVTPYIDLIRALRAGQPIADVDLLRWVMVEARDDLAKAAADERKAIPRIRAGDPAALTGTIAESLQQANTEAEFYERRHRDAVSVLAMLDGAPSTPTATMED